MPKRSQYVSIEVDLVDIQDEVIQFVKDNLEPQDVFDEPALRNWALENEFVENGCVENDE